GGWLQRDGFRDLFRGDQRTLLTCVARLPASLATGGWLRWSAFDLRSIARRRPGGVGGVLVEPLSQFLDLLLERLHPPLVLADEGHDVRLGSRRDLAPVFNRDRRNSWHANILRPLGGAGQVPRVSVYG